MMVSEANMTTQLADTQTANHKYQSRMLTAEAYLKIIAKLLKEHKAEQANKPLNWGYVGDLGKVNEELGEIAAFLRSGK